MTAEQTVQEDPDGYRDALRRAAENARDVGNWWARKCLELLDIDSFRCEVSSCKEESEGDAMTSEDDVEISVTMTVAEWRELLSAAAEVNAQRIYSQDEMLWNAIQKACDQGASY